MSDKQTEAQRLAELLEASGILEAADELRRLDAVEKQCDQLLQAAQHALWALEHVEAVYRLNVVKDGEPSSTLENLQVNITSLRQAIAVAQQTSNPVGSHQIEPAASPTAGMNLCERILHVGGRESANGYIEFGSVMAVGALIKQVLRDTRPLPAQQPLSSARIDELIEEGVFGCNPYELVRRLEEERGAFKTRPLTDEQIDAMWQQSCREHFSGLQREIHLARAIEHAHGIK